jgi:hypothetical protein
MSSTSRAESRFALSIDASTVQGVLERRAPGLQAIPRPG